MKTMIAKYPGTCSACGEAIKRGTEDEDESAGLEPGTLANDRRLAKQGLSVIRFSSGHVRKEKMKPEPKLRKGKMKTADWFFDNLGYAFCPTCSDDKTRGNFSQPDSNEKCDGCGCGVEKKKEKPAPGNNYFKGFRVF